MSFDLMRRPFPEIQAILKQYTNVTNMWANSITELLQLYHNNMQ